MYDGTGGYEGLCFNILKFYNFQSNLACYVCLLLYDTELLSERHKILLFQDELKGCVNIFFDWLVAKNY